MSESPLNSIPVLVPTSKSPTPTPPIKTRAQIDQEAEEAFNKFSTLFSPPTPRASPVLSPLFVPLQPPSAHAPEPSPDSEFGSFVSVPAEEDPLSSLMTPGLDLPPPLEATSASSSGSPTRPSHPRSTSQVFFDQFSQSAKERTASQRGLLDELLQHEDDPLYWIKDKTSSEHAAEPEEDLLPSEKPNAYLIDSLSDLDFEFFASTRPKPPTPTPHRRSSSSSSYLRSPTRSPTTTAAATLAPPPMHRDSTSNPTPLRHSVSRPPFRSSSYAALATISKSSGAKWVSSFLPAALSPPAAYVPNTNMFPPSPVSTASSSLSNSLTLPPHPATAPAPARVPELSHFSPFASTHSTRAAYVPPSGAPGFSGAEAYDWDRGFSRALERDLGLSESPTATKSVPYSDFDEGEDELILGLDGGHRTPGKANGNGTASGRSGSGNGNGPKEGVGVLLDKKMNGTIKLVGRREGTVGVLTPELVSLIHPNLPALMRLPRQWTLFYSLDQHGISLNTLYSRCDPPSSTRTPHPKGALVAMQDSGGRIFGVWVAEGLKRSTRGGYYGGGESSAASGTFDAYKWTGKNEYVALCEDGFISFGGGDAHYGLYLDDTLFDGSSARCPTFDNEPLCSDSPDRKGVDVNFECVGLEVWGVGP
ncbi:TLD-domain-containing protein [Mycena rebaudengoi]|nr:TLD-domain-containing protein [Mycena rebaudengoi]